MLCHDSNLKFFRSPSPVFIVRGELSGNHLLIRKGWKEGGPIHSFQPVWIKNICNDFLNEKWITNFIVKKLKKRDDLNQRFNRYY